MPGSELSADVLMNRSEYVKQLRPELAPEMFEPARSRVLLIPIVVAVIAGSMLAVGTGFAPWWTFPLASIVIGVSFACLAFIGHEAVHGCIVKNSVGRYVIGWIGFAAFNVSPRLWAAWHDRVHHGTTNMPGDPDMYPTLAEYNASGRVRIFVDAFSPGGRRWRGLLSLALGFSIQSTMQLICARRDNVLNPRVFKFALLETAVDLALWGTVAYLVGFVPFVFVYVIPLLIANSIVMAFILTNHALSPRCEINDPLVNSLSVTAPRWVERITLYFGYHVEHHVFPAMSSRHARSVRSLLRKHWPNRYQSMSLAKALLALHRTARVYKDAVTLVDPRTGHEFPTLTPEITS